MNGVGRDGRSCSVLCHHSHVAETGSRLLSLVYSKEMSKEGSNGDNTLMDPSIGDLVKCNDFMNPTSVVQHLMFLELLDLVEDLDVLLCLGLKLNTDAFTFVLHLSELASGFLLETVKIMVSMASLGVQAINQLCNVVDPRTETLGGSFYMVGTFKEPGELTNLLFASLNVFPDTRRNLMNVLDNGINDVSLVLQLLQVSGDGGGMGVQVTESLVHTVKDSTVSIPGVLDIGNRIPWDVPCRIGSRVPFRGLGVQQPR